MLISNNFASKTRWLIFALTPKCIKPPLNGSNQIFVHIRHAILLVGIRVGPLQIYVVRHEYDYGNGDDPLDEYTVFGVF